MTLTTTISPIEVAVSLGQPSPISGSIVYQQWQSWIDDTLALIQDRADSLPGVDISQTKLDYVVRTVTADIVWRISDKRDPNVWFQPKTVDDFWVMLGLRLSRGRAFEVDTIGNGGVYAADTMWRTVGGVL